MDLPIKHSVMLSLPEAMYNYGNTKIGFKAQFLYDTCSVPWSKFMSFAPSPSCGMVSSQDYCIEAGMRLTENQEALLCGLWRRGVRLKLGSGENIGFLLVPAACVMILDDFGIL